jgi:hypothetical protein
MARFGGKPAAGAGQAGSTGGPPDPEALAAQAENVYIRRN